MFHAFISWLSSAVYSNNLQNKKHLLSTILTYYLFERFLINQIKLLN